MGFRLFFIGIILSALLGAGAYVMKLQKDNAILKENAVKLESAIQDQKTLIENQQKDFQEILKANNKIIAKIFCKIFILSPILYFLYLITNCR